MQFAGKEVTVVGLGRSGFAAAKFLRGQKARVRVTDGSAKPEILENANALRDLGILAQTGAHTEDFLKGTELLVTSPGVPKTSLPLVWARKRGVPVISEVELAFSFCRGPLVAVTGSNGKTTTCHLIHRIFRDSGRKAVLCGNVGYSFLSALPEIDAGTVVVLELSSFQLEDSPTFHPQVAVVLNLSPNHLDRHRDMAGYTRAKERIFANQRPRDLLILNYDDERVRRMARRARSRVFFFSKEPSGKGSLFVKDGYFVQKTAAKEKKLFRCADFPLKGEHNLENMLAAAAAALSFKVPPVAIRRTFSNFRTLEHRLEPVGRLRGIHFVNDSKSTTVKSTEAAVRAAGSRVVLVAGGRDKGANFAAIEPLLLQKARAAVLYGEARAKIASSWKTFGPVGMKARFRDAVVAAYRRALPGDTVLLSPMCASFDQFKSFEERGEAFKKIFQEILSGDA